MVYLEAVTHNELKQYITLMDEPGLAIETKEF